MATDTIPSRADGSFIDQSWFNLIRTVLGGDFVPRNSSGVATDLAGSLGQSALRWLSLYTQTVLLGSQSNPITLKAPTMSAPYDLTLPAAPPSASRILSMSTSGVVAADRVTGQNIVVTSSSGTASTSLNLYNTIFNQNITMAGTGPLLISFQPDGTTNKALVGGPNNMSVRVVVLGVSYFFSVTAEAAPGAFNMVIPSGFTAGNTYAVTFAFKSDDNVTTVNCKYIKMVLREL